MKRLRANLGRARGGNVAMIAALLAPVLVLVAGGVVDLTNASMRQAQLQAAVDSAAVASVAQYSPGYQYANAMTTDGSVPDTVTQSNTQSVFNANWKNVADTNVPVVKGNACGGGTYVCKSGTAIKTVVQASTQYNSYFLQMIGRPAVQLSAVSQAVANVPTYINYYILVDISQSMGIASTPTDMASLYNRVYAQNNGSDGEKGCVFGCHVTAPGQSVTNEYLAHSISPKITLRIDSAVTAIQNIIGQAQQKAGQYKNIQIGLYTMSEDPVSGTLVNTVAPLSSNYTSLNTAAGTIDLGNNNSSGFGDSDFIDQMSVFTGMVPSNGTGAVNSPLNYVFIVTDGLQDICKNSHCDSAFSPSYCANLKNNATVGVIYTTYVPITNQNNAATYNASVTAPESNYNRLVVPYLSSIPTNLQSCASSPSLYFQASQGSDIVNAMAQLFAQTQKTARVAS